MRPGKAIRYLQMEESHLSPPQVSHTVQDHANGRRGPPRPPAPDPIGRYPMLWDDPLIHASEGNEEQQTSHK